MYLLSKLLHLALCLGTLGCLDAVLLAQDLFTHQSCENGTLVSLIYIISNWNTLDRFLKSIEESLTLRMWSVELKGK